MKNAKNNKMKAVVITSKGLGDGLIMTVLAQHLVKLGYTVDIFNPHLEELKEWFPDYNFKNKSENLNIWKDQDKTDDKNATALKSSVKPSVDYETLTSYDWVFCQYSNTPFVEELKKNRQKLKRLSLVYAAFNPQRHQPLDQDDFICHKDLPLVESLQLMGKEFFKLENPTKETGLKIPAHLHFQKYKKRLLIHPTSTCPTRTWDKKKYLQFARKLKAQGYEIAFIMHPEERAEWQEITLQGFLLPAFPNLSALASYVYESSALIGNDSGPVHLASLLNLPTLIITNDPKRLILWQPGWKKAFLAFPPKWVPNFKFLRIKPNHWQKFTSVSHILKAFTQLKLNSLSHF